MALKRISIRAEPEKGTRIHTKHFRHAVYDIARRSPSFWSVKGHTLLVKRVANAIARELGAKADRGLVNQLALAHDSFRDLPNHDMHAKDYWEKRGAKRVSENLGTAATLFASLHEHERWSLEHQILAIGDTVCRGVPVNGKIVNGILLPETAIKFLISQRKEQGYTNFDRWVRQLVSIHRIENQLNRQGINLQAILARLMVRNPRGFLEATQKSITPEIEKIFEESLSRQKIWSKKIL